jgi:serine/threonine-protein kinase
VLRSVDPGQTVGRFVVERRLAGGGMSDLYLAHLPGSAVPVLLKLPLPQLLDDPAARQRFEREGAALRRLDHPGVQRLLETGQTATRPFLALEYVDGESLRDVVRRQGRLPATEVRRLGAAIAGTLEYCHARGVVHRDLKPDNVILAGADRRPVLIDLGAVLLEGAKRITFAGLTPELGTPEYMAPEQVRGARGDARTDVYALGTLLYELLSGAPPFAGRPGDGAVQVMRRHLEDDPPGPAAPDAGDDLRGVLARALRRNPAARFQTAGELAAALADPAAAVARGDVRPGWPVPRTAAGSTWRTYVGYFLAALVVLLVVLLVGLLAGGLVPHQGGG